MSGGNICREPPWQGHHLTLKWFCCYNESLKAEWYVKQTLFYSYFLTLHLFWYLLESPHWFLKYFIQYYCRGRTCQKVVFSRASWSQMSKGMFSHGRRGRTCQKVCFLQTSWTHMSKGMFFSGAHVKGSFLTCVMDAHVKRYVFSRASWTHMSKGMFSHGHRGRTCQKVCFIRCTCQR